MADVKITLKLSFDDGQQQVHVAGFAQASAPEKHVQEPKQPPYRLPNQTASDEPTLIESASFVRVG